MFIKINDIDLKIKTVITSRDIQQGMMNKTFDDNFQGLLFFLSEGKHGFWMKDCIIPLDIIYIEDDTITKIHHNCKPCRSENCPSYIGYGNMVLELEGGDCELLNINEGDKIQLWKHLKKGM